MTVITREVQLDVGHRVPDHGSKCRNLHGHRYRVVLAVEGAPIDERGNGEDGMVIDFGRMADALTQLVHDPYDHGLILADYDTDLLAALRPFGFKVIAVPFPPTAERLAEMWANVLAKRLSTQGIVLHSLTVWETPNSSATWTPS
jgi:6-pyruvoyltetrahydropterin/6-carboxytetrahydropterin synthase